jgi:hypothetical protein
MVFKLGCDDGTVEVGSASDPLKTYTLAGQACDCQDFAYGKAPEGWCAHRIAAGIQKRVQELLPEPQEATIAAQTTVDTSHAPDASTALPEAPASVNCHITVAGRQVQLTLRDTDEGRLLARLEKVLQQFPVPAENPSQSLTRVSQPQGQGEGWCSIHHVQMKLNDKDGRQWWSHRLPDDQGWCKGRKGRP